MPPLPDDVLLLRRAAPRTLDKQSGRVKPTAFRLRLNKQERSLSFYMKSLVDQPSDLLNSAPGHGWGVAEVLVKDVIAAGFDVQLDRDPDDPVFGAAHVSVQPVQYADDGQIPLQMSSDLAEAARWVIRPDPSKA